MKSTGSQPNKPTPLPSPWRQLCHKPLSHSHTLAHTHTPTHILSHTHMHTHTCAHTQSWGFLVCCASLYSGIVYISFCILRYVHCTPFTGVTKQGHKSCNDRMKGCNKKYKVDATTKQKGEHSVSLTNKSPTLPFSLTGIHLCE